MEAAGLTDRDSPRLFSGTVGDYLGEGTDPSDERMEPEPTTEIARMIVFVDSSAMVAIADAGDASHIAAVDAYRDLISSGYRFFTTEFMIAEAYDLLSFGPGPEVARQWLQGCNIARCPVEERDLAQARQRILAETGANSTVGLSNAISLAVMDRLGVTDVFAVDQSVLEAAS
jgi:predicted nucleic acid-binding protein